MNRNILNFLFLCLTASMLSCVSSQPKSINDYIVVEAIGETKQEAINSAYRKILEQGLGVLVSSGSITVDAESRQNMISTASEGFVHSFEILGINSKPPGSDVWEITARGKVSQKAVGNALEEFSRQFRPRLMSIFNEKLGNKKSRPGNTHAELTFVSIFNEFPFVDQEQFKRVMAKESGRVVNAYGSKSALNRALKVAAEMDAEVLVIGTIEAVQSKTGLRGSSLKPVHTTIRLKMINVGTAQIWAARTEEATVPSLDFKQGAVQAIEMALKKMHPYLLAQIEKRVKAGNTIRVTLGGMDYDAFADRDIVRVLSNIAGVNTVRQRGTSSGSKSVVLEVEARMTGPQLYKKMRIVRDQMQIDFKSNSIKGNNIQLQITKLN